MERLPTFKHQKESLSTIIKGFNSTQLDLQQKPTILFLRCEEPLPYRGYIFSILLFSFILNGIQKRKVKE
jgi:hypothetical protein